MKNKKLKTQLRRYQVPPISQDNLETVKSLLAENYQGNKQPFFPFFVWQHISWKIWLLQGSLMALAVYSGFVKSHLNPHQLLGLLTGVVLLIALSCFPEIFRSWQDNMWELEASCRYGTIQIALGKIIFFGLVDSVGIIILAFVADAALKISFLQALVYLLTPFNLINIFCYSLSLKKAKGQQELLFMLGIGVLLGGIFVSLGVNGVIYQGAFAGWLFLFSGSCLGLILLIYKFYHHEMGVLR